MSRLGIVLRRIGIIGVLVCGFSSSAVADPIHFSFLRFMQGTVAAVTTDGDFGPFDKDDGNDLPGLVNMVLTDELGADFGLPTLAFYAATQHTDVSATRWSGSGTADTAAASDPSAFGIARAESVLFVNFTLAEPMSYRFTGTATLQGDGGPTGFRFAGPMGLGWVFESGNAVPVVAMRRGLLSPGDYLFEARANSSPGGGRDGRAVFEMEFTLTDPVPEPATLLLFATGAAFVGRTAWRRRREQPGEGSSGSIGEA